MLFEIKNAIVKDVLDVNSGISQSGNPWIKATVILEHKDGEHTDTYPMVAFGDDMVQMVQNLIGNAVDVKFDIRGREYNGRWYNDIPLRYIDSARAEKPAPAPAPITPKDEEINKTGLVDDPDGDLPF